MFTIFAASELYMEYPVKNIKDPKIRAYFEDITEERKPTVKLSANELETGAIQFIEGVDKALAEGDEMIARAKLGEMTKALSLSYIAEKYFGKSRGERQYCTRKKKDIHGKRKSNTPRGLAGSQRENVCSSNDFIRLSLGPGPSDRLSVV